MSFGSSPRGIDPDEELRRLDREIARLARSGGALRLRVGEALEALCRAGGHHELGFSSPEAYVRQRCGRGRRWGQEARALARRLAELPRLRGAIYAGELSWSMAQVLATHSDAETEEALVEEARSATVRSMRVRLTERARAKGAETVTEPGESGDAEDEVSRGTEGEEPSRDAEGEVSRGTEGEEPSRDAGNEVSRGTEGGEPLGGTSAADNPTRRTIEESPAEDDDEVPRRAVSILVTREEAWMWEATLKLVEHVSGHRLGFDGRVEAVLAEAWTTLLQGIPFGMEASPGSGRQRGDVRERWAEQKAAWRTAQEVQAEGRFPAGEPIDVALPDRFAPPEGAPVIPFGPVRLSYAARWAALARNSGRAARAFEALTWGIDTEELNQILRERGLPTTFEELIEQREAAERAATSEHDAAIGAARMAAEQRARPDCDAESSQDSAESPRKTGCTRDPSAPWSPEDLDAEIRALVAALQARDIELGRALLAFFRDQGWRVLGYASESQYARERVGLSHSAVKAHLCMARRSEIFPEVAEAAASGRLGFESARLVARVAQPRTVAAWLERAAERTAKHLREEVEAMELVARCEGWEEVLSWGPPEAEVLEAIFDIERQIRQGAPMAAGGIRLFPEAGEGSGQMSAPRASGKAHGELPEDEGQMSAPRADGKARAEPLEDEGPMSAPGAAKASGRGLPDPQAGRTTLRLYLREDLADLWSSLKTLWLRWRTSLGLPSFLRTLCWSVWHAWGPSLGPTGVAYEDIYVRDRWICTSPVCERTDQTGHHLTFRSQGGTDDERNLTGPCAWCHLDGIHMGRLGAQPPAPDILWRIGRAGILRVEGRRLTYER